MKTKGDVFDHLGFNEEESLSLKIRSDLMLQIRKISIKREYTQHELSKILNVPQPRISDLLNGKISKFSIDTLIDFLGKLGHKVKITVTQNKKAD